MHKIELVIRGTIHYSRQSQFTGKSGELINYYQVTLLEDRGLVNLSITQEVYNQIEQNKLQGKRAILYGTLTAFQNKNRIKIDKLVQDK